jgi:hypothetical protein
VVVVLVPIAPEPGYAEASGLRNGLTTPSHVAALLLRGFLTLESAIVSVLLLVAI